MQYTLSNGKTHVYQWDQHITITITEPEDVPEVHFRWGGRSVEFPLDDHKVDIPPELMQLPRTIRLWAYKPDHTMDFADISVYPKQKPSDYAYTPTEIRTWGQLDERIKALEDGGIVSGVSSVNGKTGTVELTAKDVGAATAEDVTNAVETAAEKLQPKGDYITQDKLQSATDKALAQAKASGEFDGPQGPQGPKGDTGDTGPQGPAGADGEPGKDGANGTDGTNGITPTIGDNGNWYLGETDTGKPSRGEKGEPGKDAVEDLSLGVTGATVGQTVKVKAVDDNGVPTAWNAVDMADVGEGWTKIIDVEITEQTPLLTQNGLNGMTQFLIEWDGLQSESTSTQGGFGVYINDDVQIAHWGAVPVAKSNQTQSYGHTELEYNGLYWETIRATGGSSKTIMFNAAQTPNAVVRDTGPANSIKLKINTTSNTPVRGALTVWGR